MLERAGHVGQVQLVPLLQQVVVVWCLVIIPGTVVIISNVISIIIVRTVRTSQTLPVDVLQYVLVSL